MSGLRGNSPGPFLGGWAAVTLLRLPDHNGTIAGQTYGGFMATLQLWCDDKGLPYEGIPVGTIKKFATGNGKASKGDMIAAMEKRGHRLKDDNERAGIVVADWRMDQREQVFAFKIRQ